MKVSNRPPQPRGSEGSNAHSVASVIVPVAVVATAIANKIAAIPPKSGILPLTSSPGIWADLPDHRAKGIKRMPNQAIKRGTEASSMTNGKIVSKRGKSKRKRKK